MGSGSRLLQPKKSEITQDAQAADLPELTQGDWIADSPEIQIEDLSKEELVESLQLAEVEAAKEESTLGIPSVHELLSTGFGKPSKDHSFTQEACFETANT